MLVLGGFISVSLVFLLASWGIFGTLPTFEELENPEKNLATEVISSDGTCSPQSLLYPYCPW